LIPEGGKFTAANPKVTSGRGDEFDVKKGVKKRGKED